MVLFFILFLFHSACILNIFCEINFVFPFTSGVVHLGIGELHCTVRRHERALRRDYDVLLVGRRYVRSHWLQRLYIEIVEHQNITAEQRRPFTVEGKINFHWSHYDYQRCQI